MKAKNIIWLHSHFLFWMGGTKYIFEVLKELRKKKNISSVVTCVEATGDFARKEYKTARLPLFSADSLTSTSAAYWLFFPFQIWRHMKYLRDLLKKKKVAVSSATFVTSMFPMNVVAALLRVRFVQLCYEPFAFFYDPEFTKSFPLPKRLFIQLIKIWCVPCDKWATRRAAQVVTLNSTTAKTIKETYGVDAVPIYAGVNTKLFRPFISKELQKKYHGKKVIAHSTDYSPVKKTDELLRLFPKILKKVPSAHLCITTTIENKDALKKLQNLAESLKIADHVEFLGFVPIQLLPQYYSLATVFVQLASSLRSGTASMALPVKEAMCCETPALRPDVGGEDVIDGKTGYLFAPGQNQTLINRVSYLLLHPQIAKKMGKRARKEISHQYSWQKTATALNQFL